MRAGTGHPLSSAELPTLDWVVGPSVLVLREGLVMSTLAPRHDSGHTSVCHSGSIEKFELVHVVKGSLGKFGSMKSAEAFQAAYYSTTPTHELFIRAI